MMQKQVKDVELEVRPCQHLRGTKYDEYILRTQTRTLGGVSVEFRARVVRQLFRYKPFAPLGQQTPKVLEGDSDVESADEEVSVRHEVPADGLGGVGHCFAWHVRVPSFCNLFIFLISMNMT